MTDCWLLVARTWRGATHTVHHTGRILRGVGRGAGRIVHHSWTHVTTHAIGYTAVVACVGGVIVTGGGGLLPPFPWGWGAPPAPVGSPVYPGVQETGGGWGLGHMVLPGSWGPSPAASPLVETVPPASTFVVPPSPEEVSPLASITPGEVTPVSFVAPVSEPTALAIFATGLLVLSVIASRGVRAR